MCQHPSLALQSDRAHFRNKELRMHTPSVCRSSTISKLVCMTQCFLVFFLSWFSLVRLKLGREFAQVRPLCPVFWARLIFYSWSPGHQRPNLENITPSLNGKNSPGPWTPRILDEQTIRESSMRRGIFPFGYVALWNAPDSICGSLLETTTILLERLLVTANSIPTFLSRKKPSRTPELDCWYLCSEISARCHF